LGSPTNQPLTRLVNEVLLAAGGGVAAGGAAGGGAVADAFACASGCPGGGADGGGAPAAAPGAGCVGSVSEPVRPVRYEQPVHAVSAMIPAMVLRKLPTP
jgi:hypothetical protein